MRNGRTFTCIVLAIGMAVLLDSGCASRSTAPFEQGGNRYRFSLILSRGIGETGACAASIAVRDLAARRRIVIPLFTARWGEKSEGAAVDNDYGARLVASVAMSADGTSGEIRAVLMRGTSLIATRTATVPAVVAKTPPKLDFR